MVFLKSTILPRPSVMRPSRDISWQKQGGWEVYERDGVCPVCCGQDGRESAMSYAKQRAQYAPTVIQVVDAESEVAETLQPQNVLEIV